MWTLFTLLTLLVLFIHALNFQSIETFIQDTCKQKTLVESSGVVHGWDAPPGNNLTVVAEEPDKLVGEDTYPLVMEETNDKKVLEFVSPINIYSNEMLLNGDHNSFWSESVFDNNNTIFNDDVILNSESKIVIGDHVLSRHDVAPIKKAVAKLKFINQKTSDITSFKDGKKTEFSSEKTGNNQCSAALWKILMNENISKTDMCTACCVRSPHNIGSIEANVICNGREYPLKIDMALSQVFDMKACIVTKKCTISLYNNTKQKCRLVLFNSDDSNLQKRDVINEVIQEQRRERKLVLEIGSEKQWGETNDGTFISSTYTLPLTTMYHWIYLEILGDN
jgi:hypothetical protein